jgi:hypothetical protein
VAGEKVKREELDDMSVVDSCVSSEPAIEGVL